MDEYEKIRQRKREEYRKRHRAQVRRKQLISNGIVIGMIILIIIPGHLFCVLLYNYSKLL